MASITPAQSSLGAELLLNKLMNGQAQSSTGKTVTAAGRAISYSLSSSAYAANVAEANMVSGSSMVSTAQSELSNLKDRLELLKKDMVAMQNTTGVTGTDIKAFSASAKTLMSGMNTALANANYNGIALFDGTAQSLNAGDGMTISVLGKEVSTSTGKLKAAFVAVGSATNAAKLADAVTAMDAAVKEVVQFVGDYSHSIKEVQNRALVLADKGANLNAAASGQAISGVAGANGLLDNILGGNTTI